MKISEACYAAADYIREHGWTQGKLRDNYGRVCLIGAMGSMHICDLFAPAFHKHFGIGPVWFNDKECRSADDAIAALEIMGDIECAEGR